MAKRAKKASASEKKKQQIEFDFLKSAFFRVIKADGVFGGLTPNGSGIHMGFYSERHPYPQKITHDLTEAGLGPEHRDRRVGRTAIVRELEVGVSFDIATAIVIRNWIDDKLQQYVKLVGPLPVADIQAQASQSNGKGKK